MKRISFVLSIVAGGLLALAAAPARADDVNKLTCLTFSAPVELPTVALPAGSYLFKHPDGAFDRHIVQVLSSDGKQVLGTFLTIPEERSPPSDDRGDLQGDAGWHARGGESLVLPVGDGGRGVRVPEGGSHQDCEGDEPIGLVDVGFPLELRPTCKRRRSYA